MPTRRVGDWVAVEAFRSSFRGTGIVHSGWVFSEERQQGKQMQLRIHALIFSTQSVQRLTEPSSLHPLFHPIADFFALFPLTSSETVHPDSPRVMAAGNIVELTLHDLLKSVYQANCLLEQEPISDEEKEALEFLTFPEVVDNLKDLISDLLDFKRQHKDSEKSELVRQSQQFEAMLQKLESEVRNHIRVEQQLKILLEAAQSRIEDLEKELRSTQTTQKDKNKPSPDRQRKAFEEKYREETVRVTQKQVRTGEETVIFPYFQSIFGEQSNIMQKPTKSTVETYPRHSETTQKDLKKTSKERLIHKVASTSSLREGANSQKQAFKPITQRLLSAHGPVIHKKREDNSARPTEKTYLQQAFHTFDATEKPFHKTHHRTSSDISKIRPFTAVLHPRSASTLKA